MPHLTYSQQARLGFNRNAIDEEAKAQEELYNPFSSRPGCTERQVKGAISLTLAPV
jgi:hypothetical protein